MELIRHFSSSICPKGTTCHRNLAQKKKNSGPGVFTDEFYEIFKVK